MVAGGGFPEGFVSILRMQNAACAKNERSLDLASFQERWLLLRWREIRADSLDLAEVQFVRTSGLLRTRTRPRRMRTITQFG